MEQLPAHCLRSTSPSPDLGGGSDDPNAEKAAYQSLFFILAYLAHDAPETNPLSVVDHQHQRRAQRARRRLTFVQPGLEDAAHDSGPTKICYEEADHIRVREQEPVIDVLRHFGSRSGPRGGF